MKNQNRNIGIQAIEFWSTVCEVEYDISVSNEESEGQGEETYPIYNFANKAMPEILPVLLSLLTEKDEEDDEDDWNISMAAGTCIQLFANVCRDEIVGPVIQFVEANIRSTDWHHRDAAVMAFGSIMDGPSEKVLGPMCQSALKILCEMMADPVPSVQDTVSWTLGRLCERLSDAISEADMPFVIQALIFGVAGSTRVGSNCSWAIMNLVENILVNMDRDVPTMPLSPYFEALISAFMSAGEK